MSRFDALFPNATYQHQVQQLCLHTMLVLFRLCPALLLAVQPTIVRIITAPISSMAQHTLVLHLCWLSGEYASAVSTLATAATPTSSTSSSSSSSSSGGGGSGGGGGTKVDTSSSSNTGVAGRGAADGSVAPGQQRPGAAAESLFEAVELLLFESIATAKLGMNSSMGGMSGSAAAAVGAPSARSRLLSAAVGAIAKLAAAETDLRTRARVGLSKVVRSRTHLHPSVCDQAADLLSLLHHPLLAVLLLSSTPSLPTPTSAFPSSPLSSSSSLLASASGSAVERTVEAHRAVALPLYLLSSQSGPPVHDFSVSSNLF
ncbi:unnamed protein product [Closterium sp. NIES-54]